VKVPVLLVRERDLEEVEDGGLVDEGKVSVQRVTTSRINADHNARSNFFQLDDAIPWYQEASIFPGGVKRLLRKRWTVPKISHPPRGLVQSDRSGALMSANLEFLHDSSETRTAGRVIVGH
jgi:hypothetical protein